MTVGIVNHGMGNVQSVRHALDWLGARPVLCESPASLEEVDRVVLPGVGSFGDCMRQLSERGLVEVLDRLVLEEKRPTLGICLGMQIMAQSSEEAPDTPGLGWFDAEVVRVQPSDPSMSVPHIGWNELTVVGDSPILAQLPPSADVYFVHGYWVRTARSSDVIATCDYGGVMTAAMQVGNICATQFHPEKSQDHGLAILANFLKWKPTA